MKAILITSCGCHKILEIPYPPQFNIKIPIRKNNRMFGKDLPTEIPFKTRIFRLDSQVPISQNSMAVYYEEWND